jgi:hypothetical protein
MKTRNIISTVLAVSLILSVALAFAQPWKGWKGSGGWGFRSQYQRMYNPQTVVDVKGTVEAVEQITPQSGMSYGIHLKVKTDAEIISVHLGPAWFIERQDIKIEKGDTIEVKGSEVIFDGAAVIIAAEVKDGESVLKLRNEAGIPVWAGSGMGKMRRMERR